MPINYHKFHSPCKYALIFLLLLLLAGGLAPAGVTGDSVARAAVTSEKLDPALVDIMAGVSLDTPLEVVIVFSDMAAASEVDQLASTFHPMRALPMAGAILTRSQIETLATRPEIYSITYNAPLDYFLAESVPLIKADQVWEQYGEQGANTTVAVIDTGIDGTHPDLPMGTKVIQNVKVLPFEASQEDVPLTDTSSGHGTHVAGTIGGTGAFSGGHYRGVAPEVKLVGLGAGEGISILTAVQAYDWVLENHEEYGIRVISNSWGSTGGEINVRNPVVIATHEAYRQGMLSVFAAGNDGGYDVMNPYSLAPWLLSVAAGTKDGQLADFSSRGKDGDYFKHPDVTAPGVGIYAARASTLGVTALDPWPNPVDPTWTVHYTSMSGTSMATPHVSGVAALLFSANPNLSPDQVMDLLTATATPMPGYALHEVGYGYLDALAAYEASLSVNGNLAEFLAGERQFSIQGVLGFDPDQPAEYQSYTFSNITPAGAEGIPTYEHPFEVPEGVLYVDVAVTWMPQVEDAYDIEVLDPEGRVVVSSGNGLEEGEAALFVPRQSGTYTLVIHSFAAVASQYEANVKVVFGQQPGDWPPSSDPAYDSYLGIVGTYKTHGVLGLRSSYYRAGDSGFIVFTLSDGAGVPISGAAGNLRVIYLDRLGNVAMTSSSFSDRGGGEYSTSFRLNNQWAGVAGPVTVQFALEGMGTLRALPTYFHVNHLETTLQSDATSYRAGDEIAFHGDVAQVNTVTTGDLEFLPLAGASVLVRLLDAGGNELAATTVQSDAQGAYQGTLVAPETARGATTLVAEASYQDPTILSGPTGWYGEAETSLLFPGNAPPSVTLDVTKKTGPGMRNFIHIMASASDPDGVADIASISMTLTDAKGRLLQTWSEAAFEQSDEQTLSFERSYRVSGKPPWTLTLTVTDSDGASATTSQEITR